MVRTCMKLSFEVSVRVPIGILLVEKNHVRDWHCVSGRLVGHIRKTLRIWEEGNGVYGEWRGSVYPTVKMKHTCNKVKITLQVIKGTQE